MNPTNRHPSASPRPATAPLERAEGILLLAVLGLIALALLAAPMALPSGYHDFADQRGWFGLPNAMDVLSNLAFALLGLLGWRALRRLPEAQLDGRRRTLATLFFAGLALTTFTSGFYHLSPDDPSLAVDRLGISLAFAGLLGLAAADRVSPRAGAALALFIGLAAPAAALWDAATGNMTPWAVVQGAGLCLLLALAWRRPRPGALGFSLLAVLGWYVAAKAMEAADAQVLAWTAGMLSGHSAKHLLAALAAWPVLGALRRAGHSGRRDETRARTLPARDLDAHPG